MVLIPLCMPVLSHWQLHQNELPLARTTPESRGPQSRRERSANHWSPRPFNWPGLLIESSTWCWFWNRQDRVALKQVLSSTTRSGFETGQARCFNKQFGFGFETAQALCCAQQLINFETRKVRCLNKKTSCWFWNSPGSVLYTSTWVWLWKKLGTLLEPGTRCWFSNRPGPVFLSTTWCWFGNILDSTTSVDFETS